MSELENIAKESFDEDFCLYLEYYISDIFHDSERPEIRTFWCDGILMPDNDTLSKKYVNDKRRIQTDAWIGLKREQWLFRMTLHLGKYSLRRYARELDLKDCIPALDSLDWITVDFDNKTIDLQLR